MSDTQGSIDFDHRTDIEEQSSKTPTKVSSAETAKKAAKAQDKKTKAHTKVVKDAIEEGHQTFVKEKEAKEAEIELKAKTLSTSDQNNCKQAVPDVVMFGDDLFKLLSKASSVKEGFMKSTKGMFTGKGCVVQVTTQQINPDGSSSVAEAVTYVPGVKISETKDSHGLIIGRKLVSTN